VDFDAFRTFWAGQPEFDDSLLSYEEKRSFGASIAFASKLYNIVGNAGFLAWDLNERIALCRKAASAYIISEEEFQKMIKSAVARASVFFDSWKEYALSCLAGAAYASFKGDGAGRAEQRRAFAETLDAVSELSSPGGLWAVYQWPKKKGKQCSVIAKNMINLLPRWKGPNHCIATDKVAVEGFRVGYMCRMEPDGPNDSGWRFATGEEGKSYMSNPSNFGVYTLNTIANGDPAIAPLLYKPFGSSFIRDENGRFQPDESVLGKGGEGSNLAAMPLEAEAVY
jgi:hypothetical protein